MGSPKASPTGSPNRAASADAAAFRFIVLLGVVSLLADVTYEGARSITGPFLGLLGAQAAAVGVVAGAGELVGYGLRLAAGYAADRTRRYWGLVIAGYATNLLAVPLLALAGRWETAAGLMVLERLGKAIRSPARDAMLSHAARRAGRGRAFGLHEALDQVGALAGPLVVAGILAAGGGYRAGFAALGLPAALAVAVLLGTRRAYPAPERFEAEEPPASGAAAGPGSGGAGLPGAFWGYAAFTALSVAGFAHFQLIGYHLRAEAVLPEAQIPLLFAAAMGTDALVALGAGRAYDRTGLRSLFVIPVLAAPLPLLVFARHAAAAWVGALLWGAVMGLQETVMRAAVADLTPDRGRGVAYGWFNTVYGGAWFLGSAAMGLLYQRWPAGLVVFVALTQAAALVALARLLKRRAPA